MENEKLIGRIYLAIDKIMPLHWCAHLIHKIEKIINPSFYIHSSDLLMPSSNGITVSQFQIVGSLLDTEIYNTGGEYLPWRCEKLARFDQPLCKKMSDKYISFLRSLERDGFSPALSKIICVQEPFLTLGDGTHRVGYLVSKEVNTFILMGMPLRKQREEILASNGENYHRKRGMPDTDIEIVMDRYNNLLSTLRKEFTGVINTKCFKENHERIMEIFSSKCTNFSTSEITLDFMTAELKTLIHNRRKEQVIIHFTIPYQEIYCKGRKLYSRPIHEIRRELDDILGGKWGYLAETITDSIRLEVLLSGIKANL